MKNSVYALPLSEDTYEDFQWVMREIVAGGGEGTICEARFAGGLTDEGVETLFRAARNEEYRALARETRELLLRLQKDGGPAQVEGVARLRRRVAEVIGKDFFSAPARREAERAIARIEELLPRGLPVGAGGNPMPGKVASKYRRRVWVTRKGIHVDRIASAWLIRRFIDLEARFKWVEKDYQPRKGEIRFDMFEAEFTHDGNLCTFEVLVSRLGLTDPGLPAIQEIVHDLDLKDGKYARPETPGIQALLRAITTTAKSDEDRLAQGSAILDGLYETFRNITPKRKARGKGESS